MNTLKDVIKPLLALLVVVLSFAYFFYCLIALYKPDPQIIIAIVAAMQIPLSYYFGNSQGAATKDQIISEQITQQNKNN